MMNNQSQGRIAVPNISAVAEAKRAALVQLSQYVLAIDAKNVHSRAQNAFGDAQKQASRIVGELLNEYEFKDVTDVNAMLLPLESES